MSYKEIRKPEFDRRIQEEIEHCKGYMQKMTGKEAELLTYEVDYNECGDFLLTPMCKYIIRSGNYFAIGQVFRSLVDDDIQTTGIYLSDEMKRKLKETL